MNASKTNLLCKRQWLHIKSPNNYNSANFLNIVFKSFIFKEEYFADTRTKTQNFSTCIFVQWFASLQSITFPLWQSLTSGYGVGVCLIAVNKNTVPQRSTLDS